MSPNWWKSKAHRRLNTHNKAWKWFFVTQRTIGNTCIFPYGWKRAEQTVERGVGSPQGRLFVWNTWVGQLQQWSFLPHCRWHPPKPHCGNTLNLEKGLTNAMFYYTHTRTPNLLTWEPTLASWTQKQRDCIIFLFFSSLKPIISEVNDWRWLMEPCFCPSSWILK